MIDRWDYVKLALYQRWRKRTLGDRLDAWIDKGFLVSDWNDWVKSQGPNAALAGVAVRPLGPSFDADHGRSLQSARANLIANLLPDTSDRGSSTAVEMERDSASVASHDDALDVLVRIEGLATTRWAASGPTTSRTTRSSSPISPTRSTPAALVST